MLSSLMAQDGSELSQEITVDHPVGSSPSRAQDQYSLSTDSDDEDDDDPRSHPGLSGEQSTEFHQMVEATRLVRVLAVSPLAA